MNQKFYKAFKSIHATDKLKANTAAFVHAEYAKRQRKCHKPLGYVATCCTMLVLIICGIGGYRLYSTPVSYISVDVNPSVELGLNRLDRVVTLEAYNEDGAQVLQHLNLKNQPYTKAVELLLADKTFAGYLSEDALLSFTVVSKKEEALLMGIRKCQGFPQSGAVCSGADAQLMEEAHGSGLSFGKYRAFLELSQYDPSVTPESCRGLSMRQIRDRIRQYTNGEDPTTSGGMGRGQGKGNGNGNGNGRGCGNGNGMGRPLFEKSGAKTFI